MGVRIVTDPPINMALTDGRSIEVGHDIGIDGQIYRVVQKYSDNEILVARIRKYVPVKDKWTRA
jgi:hypothetical protein